ncbi:hypothetical protein GCM10011529_09410 [Polymorphobacter glacialis]|uniref:TNase-like domain-containing protein n=1 Tax=Sandarakinorhabdus glacialis TaxID=1614636 RepID=A0A916ZPI7_9SPHN|nr:DUF1294 domain-containing protein [Polymorphobacter glacialis]GGE05143.1 hypothetical protein GCM10011529_09410 [Polymorphobacter glacialis]
MPLLTLIAAASFACANPRHHDGDAIRCAGDQGSMRLHGIDAPEMPGACRPGRDCTPGDPYAARNTLAGLTRGRNVRCEQVDTDHYGRKIVSCEADGQDLGCAMIASGHAVERYGNLNCGGGLAGIFGNSAAEPTGEPTRPGRTDHVLSARPVPDEPGTKLAYVPEDIPQLRDVPWRFVALYLLAMNLVAYIAFAIDKRRAAQFGRHRVRRIPESTLLGLAALGGSIGAIAAQQRLRHKTSKQPFAMRLLAIAGLQVGVVAGIMYFAA